MTEVWKVIADYPGYEVSSLGNVRSLDRVDSIGRKRKGRVLKPIGNGIGYYQVTLSKDGKATKFYLHQLVA